MNYVALIEIVGVVGVWLLVVWLSKMLITLKNGIAAQKAIIDSFKAQSDWINNVHGTLSRLYDPKEIENIINVKVEKIRQQDSKNKADGVSYLIRSHYSALSFIAHSLLYLSDSAIEDVIRNIKEKDEDHFLGNFIRDTRTEILKVRNAELARLLARAGSEAIKDT